MSPPQWVQAQHNAFLRWCNVYMEKAKSPPLKDLQTDFKNGVKLIALVEAVSGESLGRFTAKPNAMQAYENVGIALDYVKHNGVVMHGIGATDIVEGNLKLILGMIWMLILRYTLADITAEGETAKEGLMLWCRRKTAGYKEVDVRDFGSSWKSGLAFCALLDRYRPDLVDFSQLDPAEPRKNVALALAKAQEAGIPALVEVDDVCGAVDDKLMITYMAYWYHAFSSLDNLETAGRRIEKFMNVYSIALALKAEYETRMRKLLAELRECCSTWAAAPLVDYKQVQQCHNELVEYKNYLKRDWITEKSELIELFGNIRIKLATYALKAYTPPRELSVQSLNKQWKQLLDAEKEYTKKVSQKLKAVKEQVRQEFADVANELALSLATLSLTISELDGELESQLLGITATSEALEPLERSLEQLAALDAKCGALGIEENDYTVYTFSELQFELELAASAVSKKLVFVENQMAVREMTNVTPAQLEEFEAVFRHFDKDQHNSLGEPEFAEALASLGMVMANEELEYVFSTIADPSGKVSFHNFIVYMISETEDRQSVEQVRESLDVISGGKGFVTREDLENALLSDDVIDSLLAAMPTAAASGGPQGGPPSGAPSGPTPPSSAEESASAYDYVAYLDRIADEHEPPSGASASEDDSPTNTSQSSFVWD